MHLVLDWTGWIVLGLALAGTVYALAAAMTARLPSHTIEPVDFPPVTILKPLHFDEPCLEDNLRSFCAQDYPAPVQIVFGVQDAADSAISVVMRLQATHPGLDIDLVIDTRSHGSNAKVSNLINMRARAKHDVLIHSDSDIAVAPDYLRAVTGILQQAGIGAVTCLYTGHALPNPWSRLAAMGIDTQFLPNVLFGTRLGLATPCFGSTIAVTAATLERIGGFEAFADRLADDYEIGRAVRATGLSVAVAPFAVAHTCAEQSFAELTAHELRWARTIRVLDPAGHWGSLITYPLPLALLGACFAGFSPFAIGVIAVALAARLALKIRIERLFKVKAGPAWLLPPRDVLSFGVFIISLFGGKVSWRGSRFLVSPDGALS
jgi:ceramide glucosyltransferase